MPKLNGFTAFAIKTGISPKTTGFRDTTSLSSSPYLDQLYGYYRNFSFNVRGSHFVFSDTLALKRTSGQDLAFDTAVKHMINLTTAFTTLNYAIKTLEEGRGSVLDRAYLTECARTFTTGILWSTTVGGTSKCSAIHDGAVARIGEQYELGEVDSLRVWAQLLSNMIHDIRSFSNEDALVIIDKVGQLSMERVLHSLEHNGYPPSRESTDMLRHIVIDNYARAVIREGGYHGLGNVRHSRTEPFEQLVAIFDAHQIRRRPLVSTFHVGLSGSLS